MHFLSRVGRFLADDRLLYNAVGIHVLLGLTLLVSFILRRLLVHGSNRLAHVSASAWLTGVGQEAARRARTALFWVTLAVMALVVAAGGIYHALGRNLRADAAYGYSLITWRHVVRVGTITGELALLGFSWWLAILLLRRWLPRLHIHLALHIGPGKDEALRRWVRLLERYALLMLALAATWCIGQILGIVRFADLVIAKTFWIVTILSVSHLLILSCRTLSQLLRFWGDRRLAASKFGRYWDRVTRLFPFGERCFEAAIYVTAAAHCVTQFKSIHLVDQFGPRIVECIGIFFGTRVVIELLQVLLNQAFGIYDDPESMDQKRLTLVPLLQSVGQYALYLFSGIIMLEVLGIPTSPILAGAGILGLAGGLGAQSLVTDVVSGFFILFENQYLVGDFIRIGDSSGKVEAVSIRTTEIRDEQGRLHIIPNGQIKGVVNYSKVFIIAQVDIKLPAERNLDEVFRAMAEAGRRLRAAHKEVQGDTVIRGLVDLGPNEMTVRATTRVQPGAHHHMEAEYRRLLKEVFDEQKAQPRPAAPALAA
jgi:small conductance mechanosensitive channel